MLLIFERNRPISHIVAWDDWDYVRLNSQSTNTNNLQKRVLYLNKIMLTKVYIHSVLKNKH